MLRHLNTSFEISIIGSQAVYLICTPRNNLVFCWAARLEEVENYFLYVNLPSNTFSPLLIPGIVSLDFNKKLNLKGLVNPIIFFCSFNLEKQRLRLTELYKKEPDLKYLQVVGYCQLVDILATTHIFGDIYRELAFMLFL